jgi:hypothetical protein
VPDDGSEDLEEQVLFVLRKILGEAFGGTPNLKEVAIITPCEAAFRRHNYVSPTGIMASDCDNNDVIHVEESRVTAEVLYTLTTRALVDAEVHVSAFQLASTGLAYPKKYLPNVSITETTLAATSRALQHVERFEVMIHHNETLNPSISLGRTLGTMASLTRLQLRIAHARGFSYPRHCDYSTTAAIQSLRDVHLPRLTCLTVYYVTFDESVLRSFLLSHASTLQSIALENVYLGKSEQWHAIVALLLDEMVCLNTLHLTGPGVDVTQPSSWGKVDLVGRDPLMIGLCNMLERA